VSHFITDMVLTTLKRSKKVRQCSYTHVFTVWICSVHFSSDFPTWELVPYHLWSWVFHSWMLAWSWAVHWTCWWNLHYPLSLYKKLRRQQMHPWSHFLEKEKKNWKQKFIRVAWKRIILRYFIRHESLLRISRPTKLNFTEKLEIFLTQKIRDELNNFFDFSSQYIGFYGTKNINLTNSV